MILGGIANAIICVAIALLTLRVRNQWVRLAVVLIAAYVGSYAIFALGVRVGGLGSEASSWVPVFVKAWAAAGAVAGVAAVIVSFLLKRGSGGSDAT